MNKSLQKNKHRWLVGAMFASAMALPSVVVAQQEQVWSYTYNDLGLKATEDGPRTDVTDVTTYTYYDNGDLHTVTNALGHVMTYNSYDAAGRATSVTDANGVTTEFRYHPRGWLLESSILNPSSGDSLTTVYDYYADGELKSITQPNNSVLTYKYNAANHLTDIENDLGEKIHYDLDAAGNQTQQTITSADGTIVYVVQHAYDELSRVMNIIGNHGQNNHIDYDVNDNPVADTDARNAVTEKQYDALNRLTRFVDAEDGEIQYTYDAQDRIRTVTDGRGNVTTYDYDGLGNLLSLTSPDTGVTTYDYDSAGNRIYQQDSRGVEVFYTYDALNRLTSVTYPSDTSLNIQYQYDQGPFAKGRLTQLVDGSGSTQYQYDFMGRLSQQVTELDGRSYTTMYRYSGQQLQQIEYPSGRVVSYLYDDQGRISDVETQAPGSDVAEPLIMGMAYLPFGPAKSWLVGNGLQQSILYDLDYRIQQIQLNAGQALLHRDYAYDTVDNITDIDNGVDSTKNQSFEYDLVNRLTDAQGIYGQISYSYDEVGNRLTRSHTENGETLLEIYDYEALSNRLTQTTTFNGATEVASREFIYDPRGNVIQQLSASELLQYEYSAENRMATVASSGQLQGTFSYNALGQRVKADYGSHSEYFIYGQSGELLAIVNDQGQTLREYLYAGASKIALAVYSGASDEGIDLTGHIPYGGQDGSGSVTLSADGKGITLAGNRWRSTQQTFTVTANTYISFDFESDGLGEVQGIGLDANPAGASTERIFNLAGTQVWGIRSIRYSGGVQHFDIPVGQYYTGSNMVIALVNDNDADESVSTSTLRNIRVCEGPCSDASVPTAPSDPDVPTVDLSFHRAYANQDSTSGSVTIGNQGSSMTLTGNRWRATLETFTVTANTVVEFDFNADGLGEVQGIALDENVGNASPARLFNLSGTQTWGIEDIRYGGNGTERMVIPVGQYFTGTNMVLGLVNDNDANPEASTATISNLKICEGSCTATGSGSGSTTGGAGSDQLYYVHNDHLGTIQMLTDADQNVVWSVDYTPFGVIVDGSETFESSRFPGQYFDVATGVSYNYFRDYDPSLGRYLQSDPIGLAGGINTYAYVGGNPLSFSDPSGLIPKGKGINVPGHPIPGVSPGVSPGNGGPYDHSLPPWAQPTPTPAPGAGLGCALARMMVGGYWLSAAMGCGNPPVESRGHQDPVTARPFNPGRDCDGNCNPCPPNQMWPTEGGGHGHPNGVWHSLIWNQNPKTCMCYPDRPSQGLMGW